MPFITIISDMGRQDASLAYLKYNIQEVAKLADIVEITLDLQPFNTKQASYVLAGALNTFPEGTIHLVLVDVFYERAPELCLHKIGNQYVIMPKNAIGLPTQQQTLEWSKLILKGTIATHFSDWCAACISLIQEIVLDELQVDAYANAVIASPKPWVYSQAVMLPLEIIYIDHYGNAVLDFSEQQLATILQERKFNFINVDYEQISKISNHYNDVKKGILMCRINKLGFLELCMNRGKFATFYQLGLGMNDNRINLHVYDSKNS
jgi:S-adenosylmethionine hydrolase